MLLTFSLVVTAIQGCYASGIQEVLQGKPIHTATRTVATRPSSPGKCLRETFAPAAFPQSSPPSSPPLTVQPLIVSGSASNRVNLVFFSDGYLLDEQGKFFEDAARLAEDISGNQTFSTVRPLLNFWAAFSPSNESGIGMNGIPKDTPFGLFRDGTELRAVYYSKPEVAEAACSSLGEQCDYPILLGNDPYYGGLGGDYTVITSSLANGPLVLRHELGHSIIDVGEEYDGGYAYFGPNAAHDLSQPLPWAHWLSPIPHSEVAAPRVERSVMPLQEYAWTMLSTSTPWSTNFTSSGAYSRHLVRFSLSGLPEASNLKVLLDGNDLGWIPKDGIGLDRWHYDIFHNYDLSPGQHEVKFALVNSEREGTAQLCSVEIIEYGNEDEFISTPGHYGIYPTFSEANETSYRPTNEDCLMRIVTSPNFCKVCIEGLWLSLLRRVSLIDDVKEACEWRPVPLTSTTQEGSWIKTLDLQLVPLAQFRSDAPEVERNESYTITWWKDRRVLKEFTNMTRIEVAGDHQLGTYSISVKFSTDEVKVDKEKLLSSGIKYTVKSNCGT
ncbi:hypothetical protein Hypma_014325 [Hypsizygus marmoreus]|uniref:IgA peptidase M64 n=1 Tax=Hypsizygus marmoreus TaxID=39966 RepID=A0A369JB42_HYPMA|nr:hypothetical protein Hypma_014325 [Hypsizygus marmoreus]